MRLGTSSVTGRTYGTLPGASPAGGADAFVHVVGLDGSDPHDLQFGPPSRTSAGASIERR
ncbi:MAG: hypothetical protein ACJ76P_02555 [Actinomycetota bacterium]